MPCTSITVYQIHQDFGQDVPGSSRCDLKKNLIEAGCRRGALEYPTSKMHVTENKDLSDKASGSTTDVTQIKPQSMQISLRPGEFINPKTNDRKLHVLPLDRIVTLAFHRWFPGLHAESPSGWGLPCGLVLSDGPVLLHEWRLVSVATAGARPDWRDEQNHQ